METPEEQRRRLAEAHQRAQDPPESVVPSRAGREGDTQPMPVASDSPVMHVLVADDLMKRLQVGIERYGQPLQAHNGRNALQDAYEEVLDLAVYLRQAIYEQEHPRPSED